MSNERNNLSEKEQEEINKSYAVGQYLKGLGTSISEMMKRGDHPVYTWNNGGDKNPHRKEMLDAIHEKAMEALKTLD